MSDLTDKLDRMTRFVALVMALCACSRAHDHKAVSEGSPNDRVAALREAYEAKKAEYAQTAPASGWPSETDCDGTLWAGLARAAGVDVRLDLAEHGPGEIHRRPYLPCWTEDDGDIGSRSTISNDMLIGYLWGKWTERDLAGLRRLADFGESHDWFMGKPESEAARVVLKPNQIGLLGRMLYALGDQRAYRRLFEVYAPVTEDYEQHIQALGIALQGSVNEALRHGSLDATVEDVAALLDLNDQMMTRIKELAAAEPENPLFQAVLGTYTGDFTKATELLLEPSTPVPSYVRGDQPDNYWRAEWLFAAHLVLERY